jgi:hypothetical protein
MRQHSSSFVFVTEGSLGCPQFRKANDKTAHQTRPRQLPCTFFLTHLALSFSHTTLHTLRFWRCLKWSTDTKTLITNKCTNRVLSSIVVHSYMFRPCWVIFRENCVVFRGVNSLRSRPAGTAEFTPPVHSTQSTAHYHSTIKCNLSVTITKSCPWKWPSRVETCRSVLRLMIKLSLCICWW